jgi:biotin carboxyl carrier protein
MAKFRDLANANVSGEGNAEELGALIDALLPVLVDRLAETGLGEIEVERNGATVRVRSESLGVQQAAAVQGSTAQAPVSAAAPAPSAVSAARKHAVRATAVGFLTLSKEIHVGAKVAKGALVATVEVLGIPSEVRATHGGIVAALKSATGDPVEYGQEIFLLESIGEGPK